MTPAVDVLDEIIGTLDPEDIPVDFILMAKVTDFEGRERVLRGSELQEFLDNPFSVAEVRVLLDIKGIRAEIMSAATSIFAQVAQKLAK